MKIKHALLALILTSCGQAGRTPLSCTVQDLGGAALVSCPDGSSATISDGEDGLDGASIEFVDPCPHISAPFPELLALVDNKYYAVYASGVKIHLAYLKPGGYITTDGRSCVFTISPSGQLQ